jgi:tRNA (mo5U34)-methyltransferase
VSTTVPDTRAIAARAANLDWYHVMDLAPGVTTHGMFDTRAVVDKVRLPDTLQGKRCLDVGTWDGFWAFELERRGGDVVAIDLDDPSRWDWPADGRHGLEQAHGLEYLRTFKGVDTAFRLAHEAYGSNVERRDLSVYDLDPDTVGRFDFAFLGALLLHLRDPVRALEALRSVLKPDGVAIVCDNVDVVPTLLRPRTPVARLEGLVRPWWWQPNRAGLLRMLRSAGWTVEDATPLFFLPLGPAHERPPLRLIPRSLLNAQGRERAITRLLGLGLVAVLVRP